MKRYLLAVLAVFVAWSVLDFVIHGLILTSTYAATAQFWRPMAEMKMGLMKAVTIVAAACFTGIYAGLIRPKSTSVGMKFGLLFGLGSGFSMGFGTYSVMPLPVYLAAVWFVGTLLEGIVAGLIVSAIVKGE